MPQFFEEGESLEVFANVFDMLKPQVRETAVRLASKLIIRIARNIADSGYRSGKLKLVRGFSDAAEIELDRSLENIIDHPEAGILPNIVSFAREKERSAFVMMVDHSYSMRGLKIVLAAITAATIAYHFKRDYAVLAFSDQVTVLKGLNERIGPEKVLEKLFGLTLRGDTNIGLALKKGLEQLGDFEQKKGLLLTDGAWTSGNPQEAASLFDKLNVLCFPPAKPEKIQSLAVWGKGEFAYVGNEFNIAPAVIKCLG